MAISLDYYSRIDRALCTVRFQSIIISYAMGKKSKMHTNFDAIDDHMIIIFTIRWDCCRCAQWRNAMQWTYGGTDAGAYGDQTVFKLSKIMHEQ